MNLVVMVDSTPNPSRRAPTVVVLEEQNSLGLCHVHLRDRIHTLLRSASLDHQLAAGASPESSVPIALHAARLYRPKQRRRLAASLREVAAAARGSRRTRAPINRESIRLALAELETLARRLETNGPIDVRGIARVRVLLGDGAGPLYRRTAPRLVQRELMSVLVACDAPA
jgi:hypothetical protein